MSIDWVTVVAQIINFLVLVWLLHHFLYEPIVRNMDARQQAIADRLREAQEEREAAEREAATYRRKQQEVEDARTERLEAARHEAAEERRRLRAEAEQEMSRQRRQWLQDLDAERQSFAARLRQLTAERFCTLARRALADLADAELEREVARAFGTRLRALDGAARQDLAAAARAAGGVATLASAFELPQPAQDELREAVRDALGPDVDVRFTVDAELACGVELKTAERACGWSLAAYLDTLEEEVLAGLAAFQPGGGDPAEEAPDATGTGG